MFSYSFKDQILEFAGIDVIGTGAAEDGFTVSFETDSSTDEAGASGDVAMSVIHDARASVTVSIQAGAAVNDLLSGMHTAKVARLVPGAGIGPLFIKDLNGTTRGKAEHAWILRVPDLQRASEHQPIEWVIRCAKLTLHVGGMAA